MRNLYEEDRRLRDGIPSPGSSHLIIFDLASSTVMDPAFAARHAMAQNTLDLVKAAVFCEVPVTVLTSGTQQIIGLSPDQWKRAFHADMGVQVKPLHGMPQGRTNGAPAPERTRDETPALSQVVSVFSGFEPSQQTDLARYLPDCADRVYVRYDKDASAQTNGSTRDDLLTAYAQSVFWMDLILGWLRHWNRQGSIYAQVPPSDTKT